MQSSQAEGNCEYIHASMYSLAIEQLIMEIKFCINKICLSIKSFTWRMFLSMMKSRLNFLSVSSKYNWAGRNNLNLSSVLFQIPVRKKRKIRIMPKNYQKQLNLWIRGWHSTTDIGHGKWLFRSSRAGPFFSQKRKKRPLISYNSESHDPQYLDPRNRWTAFYRALLMMTLWE